MLAAYAVRVEHSRGRRYPEPCLLYTSGDKLARWGAFPELLEHVRLAEEMKGVQVCLLYTSRCV